MRHRPHSAVLCLTALVCVLSVFGSVVSGADTAARVLEEFDRKKVDFTYMNFGQDAVVVRDGVVRFDVAFPKGGAGINGPFDLTDAAELVPAIRVRSEAGNQSAAIRLLIIDEDNNRHTYDFALPAPEDAFTLVTPKTAIALGQAGGDKPLDLSRIKQLQLQGDWKTKPLKAAVDRIELVPQTPEMVAAAEVAIRKAREESEAKAAEAAALAAERRALLEKGVAADPHGPRTVHVGAVDPRILGIEIEAGQLLHGQKPYEPRPGDSIEPADKKKLLVWRDGKIAQESRGFVLKRDADADGKKEEYASITQAYQSDKQWLVRDEIAGAPLTEVTVDAPEAYQVVSKDDPNFVTPVQPAAVHRKSRPLNKPDTGSGGWVMEHKIYLVLPHALKPGMTYTVRTPGLNLQKQEITYTHNPLTVRSEAIHTSHIGYRPDDPFKRASLSLWLGTGGGHAFEGVEQFHLLDSRGNVVFTGPITLARAGDAPETLKEEKNYAATPVYHLDFSAFATPGEYRVHVPDIGVSYPFSIADQGTWSKAFQTSMHGFLSHRSGIRLGAPFTTYERPRNMHPQDVPIFRAGLTRFEGESDAISRGLSEQLGESLDVSKLRRHEQAWGGYMDAGDFDRRSQHLAPTYLHLELLSLFPRYFEELKLALPPEEAANNLPDLLDEALFNLAFYRRLQEPDGGVGGGVESTAHPRDGQASWQESLLIGVFDPDPVTSYLYAAGAAKAAGLLEKHDASVAAGWRESAAKAFVWAKDNIEPTIARIEQRKPPKFNADKLRGEARSASNLAAAELYRLTREPAYHEHLKSALPGVLESPGKNLSTLFAYATLAPALADPDLQQQAKSALVALADAALEFQKGNSFALTTHAPGIPALGYLGYWSVPEMSVGPVLPRAYALTGEQKYLAGAVAAAHYSAGANPMNMTMTTGVGHDWPTGVLHIDSRVSGQATPAGITVFGQCDPAVTGAAYDWAHNFHLGKVMTPYSRRWPGHEAYVGMYKWPAVNEYTIHQTMGPTSYYWGFLAARDSASAAPGAARR